MLHRREIRALARAAIAAGVPAFKRVSGLRTPPTNPADLPTCEVLTDSETWELLADDNATGSTRSDHVMVLFLRAAAIGDDDVQDALDDLAEASFIALLADAAFMAKVQIIYAAESTFHMGDEGARNTAGLSVALTFRTYT